MYDMWHCFFLNRKITVLVLYISTNVFHGEMTRYTRIRSLTTHSIEANARLHALACADCSVPVCAPCLAAPKWVSVDRFMIFVGLDNDGSVPPTTARTVYCCATQLSYYYVVDRSKCTALTAPVSEAQEISRKQSRSFDPLPLACQLQKEQARNKQGTSKREARHMHYSQRHEQYKTTQPNGIAQSEFRPAQGGRKKQKTRKENSHSGRRLVPQAPEYAKISQMHPL